MKAVRISEFGGPETLIYGDYPMPEVGADDVLVRVMATTVSRWDLKYRSGEVAAIGRMMTSHGGHIGRSPFPMPMQLGRDATGVVAAVGPAVKRFKVGERVVGLVHPENSASLEAIRGLGHLSTGVDLPGHTAFGGNAQFVARPQSHWLRIADAVSFDDVAAAMWALSTSHHIVTSRLGVRLGDWVLITGASGGMGSATLQLVRRAGGNVIATTRSSRKSSALLAAGANHVLDIAAPDILQNIRDITGGQGVDGAVEFTGDSAALRLCIDALRLGGTVCPVAGEAMRLPVSVSDLVSKEINLHGVRASTRNDQRIALQLVEQGVVRLPIFATFPLSECADAHRLLESGEVIGRLVLHPWESPLAA